MATTNTKRKYRKRGNRRRRFNQSGKRVLRQIARTQTYPFKRFVHAKSTVTGDDTVNTQQGTVTFALNDLQGYTEFTTLFDQFKISGVAYRWCIAKDPMVSTTGTAGTKFYPRLVWAHDFDDSNNASVQDLYQYPNMKEFWFGDNKQCTKWYYIRPAKLTVGYETGALSSYKPDWKGFIDMASYQTPHYGIKWASQNSFTGVQIYLQCKYYIVCKNVR